LARIILSSSKVGDLIFDPFAGTATTLVVAKQLLRNSIGIELNPLNIESAEKRLSELRNSDNILKFRNDYRYTEGLDDIWRVTDKQPIPLPVKSKNGTLAFKF
jgi:tRNA G10  N-methylase Trm11